MNEINCVELGSDYLIGIDVISDFTINNIVADTLISSTNNPTIISIDFTIPIMIEFPNCSYNIDLDSNHSIIPEVSFYH